MTHRRSIFGQFGLPLAISTPNVFSNDNFITANARLTVPLYTSGLIRSGIDAAGAALDANRAHENAFLEDVKLTVAELFVAVLRTQRALNVATTNVNSLQAHVTDVENLFRKGLVPQNDRLSVEVSLAHARQTELQARAGLGIARSAYNRRLGRAPDEHVALDEVMPTVSSFAMSEDLDVLTATTLQSRRELQALMDRAATTSYLSQSNRGVDTT
jgi:outer membrane protein TolC